MPSRKFNLHEAAFCAAWQGGRSLPSGPGPLPVLNPAIRWGNLGRGLALVFISSAPEIEGGVVALANYRVGLGRNGGITIRIAEGVRYGCHQVCSTPYGSRSYPR